MVAEEVSDVATAYVVAASARQQVNVKRWWHMSGT